MFSYNPIQFNNNNNNNNIHNMNMNINYQPSPAMVTPLLESSSLDTPFLDSFSADTPPFFDTASDISPYLMYASFADSHKQNNNSKDVFIAGYLDGHENSDIAKLTHDPLKFNGDPSVLLIDKSKSPHLSYPSPAPAAEPKPSPTVKLEIVTEEDSDSLFPPLNSSQQSMNTESQSSQDVSLDQLLGFDPSSPLSEVDSDDYVVDEEAQQHENKQEKPVEQQQSRKRRASESTAASSSSSSAPSTKKTKTSDYAKKGAIEAKKSQSVKMFQCPLCPHMSKRRYNLSTHMKTHDKNRIKEFDCLHEGCNKSFDRRHDRDRHLATVHRGERSYNCTHCKSHFSRRDALNRHLVQKHDYDEDDFAE